MIRGNYSVFLREYCGIYLVILRYVCNIFAVVRDRV